MCALFIFKFGTMWFCIYLCVVLKMHYDSAPNGEYFQWFPFVIRMQNKSGNFNVHRLTKDSMMNFTSIRMHGHHLIAKLQTIVAPILWKYSTFKCLQHQNVITKSCTCVPCIGPFPRQINTRKRDIPTKEKKTVVIYLFQSMDWMMNLLSADLFILERWMLVACRGYSQNETVALFP